MAADPGALFRRLVEEVINQANLDAIPDWVTPDYVDHTGGDGGPQGYRETMEFVRNMFTGLQLTVHDTMVEGDRVAARFSVTAKHTAEFMGVPATGRDGSWDGIGIVRWVDGKMAERWNVSDMMSLYEQVTGDATDG